jgi:hypothetical protein
MPMVKSGRVDSQYKHAWRGNGHRNTRRHVVLASSSLGISFAGKLRYFKFFLHIVINDQGSIFVCATQSCPDLELEQELSIQFHHE